MYICICNVLDESLSKLCACQVTLPEHKYYKDAAPATVTNSSGSNNNDDDHGSNFNVREVAATKIQVMVRGYFARRLVSMIMLDRVIRVWKPEIMKGMYVCMLESWWIIN